ncbi:MAG: protein YgfX [Pseudomonadota bacterium]
MIININKSLIMITIVLSTHIGALLLLVVLPIALVFRIGLATLIGVSFWWQWRHGIWVTQCEVKLEEDASCTHTANGEQHRYRITRATVHAGFVRLTMVRTAERTRTQLVLRDAVDPEVYRTLRARIVQRRLPVPDQVLA